VVTVRDLPASAGDVIMLYAWLDNRGGEAPDPKEALARVRGAIARHQGDVLAIRTLALAEMYWGDKARANSLLDGLLAASPGDSDLLRLKAEALLAADARANRGEARRLLVRAAKAAPADWRALHLYVHTSDIERGPVDDNLFNVVQRMWELAPQASGIVIDMATVLVRKGRMADAAKVLEPVAFAPHGDGYAALARSLREAALAGDAAAFVKRLEDGPPKMEEPEAAK
jgi:thioredoxin-like negative regulator of GroEL